MEILPEEAEFLHADGRTDRQTRQIDRQTDRDDEANRRPPQFCERA